MYILTVNFTGIRIEHQGAQIDSIHVHVNWINFNRVGKKRNIYINSLYFLFVVQFSFVEANELFLVDISKRRASKQKCSISEYSTHVVYASERSIDVSDWLVR